MKKQIVKTTGLLLLAAMLMTAFTACKTPVVPADDSPAPTEQQAEAPTNEPTEEPTAAPIATDEPTEAPSDDPGEAQSSRFPVYQGDAPVSSGILGVLQQGVPAVFDIDFDGLDDTITAKIAGRESDGTSEFVISITRGAYPDDPFVYSVPGLPGNAAAYVLDCDTSDNRLDILFCADGRNGEASFMRAFRVDRDGTAILVTQNDVGRIELTGRFSEEDAFDATLGIPVYFITQTLDTQAIRALVTVTDNGFELLTPYRYDDPEITAHGFRELQREMEVTVIKDGVPGEKLVLQKGDRIAPYETDQWSYLDLLLEDGTIVRAEISVGFKIASVKINGIDQKEYCEIRSAE